MEKEMETTIAMVLNTGYRDFIMTMEQKMETTIENLGMRPSHFGGISEIALAEQ